MDELFGMTDADGNSELTLQAHHAAWPFFWVTGALAKARDHISKGLALYRRDTHGEQALQYGGHDASRQQAVTFGELSWLTDNT